jgi:AraC-like DNA-binding protein
MDIRFWQSTTTECTPRHWNTEVAHEPWAKLYIVAEGRAAYAVARNGEAWQETTLIPGRIYLIPGSRRHHNSCRQRFTLEWCHFTVDADLEPRLSALSVIASWPMTGLVDAEDRTALVRATGAGRLRTAGLVLKLLSLLPEPPADPHAAERARLAPALGHLEYRFTRPHTVADLAHRCGLKTSRFQQLFHDLLGTSPGAYVITLRLAEARRLLASTTLGIAEIGARVGWSNPYHFSRIFRQHLGCSPRAWRVSLLTPDTQPPAR